MLARVQSFVLQGIDAHPCEIELDIADAGTDRDSIVGLPDAAVKESLERVKSALLNSGYATPRGRMLVNLAPADVRKEGPVYDLPMALGLLIAEGIIRGGVGDRDEAPVDPRRFLVAGELALDGRVRPVRGALAMALLARQRGMRGVIVPADNALEAAVVEGVEVLGVRTVSEVVGLFNAQIEPEPHPPVDVAGLIQSSDAEVDFAEVRGQEAVKRAITIAAAGGHNLLMLGPAGTGKTMMAKALPGILPPLSVEEALEVTRIYSAVGLLAGANRGDANGAATQGRAHGPHAHANGNGRATGKGLITTRPVRTPHHTASAIAVIGGGAVPKPGEISLAHRGILFLDELPEFPRGVLDTLRQPLEDGDVTIARAHSAARFPTEFMLVAAMNPTPKGDVPVDDIGRRAMDRYLGRLSRPLIDRIDIHVEAPAVPWSELAAGKDRPRGTSTAQMRERVINARDRQRARQSARLNARLSGSQLDDLAPMAEAAKALLGQAISQLGLSARAYDKVRRVARTIADIEGKPGVEVAHIAEAVQYRLLDRMV